MKKILVFIISILLLFSVCSCLKNNYNNTIRFNKNSTHVIAHRGLSGLEIENTKEAFEAAGKCSYYGIEADVRKTIDGNFIISHDETLERLSGKNINVESSTLSELLKVELYFEGKKIDKVGHLCDLGTYISICKNYNKQAILELKSSFTKEEISKIINIINSYGYINSVTFISFNYTNLKFVREFLPNQSVQYLFSKLSDEITEQLIEDKIDVAISYHALTKEVLLMFHNAGLTVNCWTIDDKTVAEQLSSLGVDYITTNILE